MHAIRPDDPQAPPRVERVAPCGGQRGTDVEVTFRGQRLAKAVSVMALRDGIEVVSVTDVAADRCKAVLRLPANCPLGAHPLRLCTRAGVANVVIFEVGVLPEVEEHRDGDAVQAIALGTTVNAELRAEETDRYAIDVAAGARVVCEVNGMRLGFGPLDTALEVVGPDGATVATADDTALGHKDPWLAFTAAAAGRHEVRVTAAFADRSNEGPYRLHVGAMPRPLVATPCGGAPGAEIAVTALGDVAPIPVTVKLPDDGSDIAPVFPQDERGTAPSPVWVRVGGPPEQQPRRDDKDHAWLDLPASTSGVVDGGAPLRYWFAAKKGAEIEFRVYAQMLRSPLDPLMIVRAADGRYLASNDDAMGADCLLRWSPPADGDYTVEVRDLLHGGSPLHVFRLEAAPRSTPMRARMVTQRDEDAALSLPRGGRAGGVLQLENVDSKAIERGVQFVATGLPAGVTAEFGPVQKGANLVPFTLTATADAEIASAWFALGMRTTDDGTAIDPGYEQVLPLVSVRNNQAVLSTVARRLPVAVADALPFRVSIEAPTVPLVRGASLGVTVKIERDEGYTGDVFVRALWTPSGVGAGRVRIAGKSDSGTLPLDANEQAPASAFPLAVIATTGRGGAQVTQVAAFVQVQVDKPWVTVQLRRARLQQGTAGVLAAGFARAHEIAGECTARLSGLPKGVTAEPARIAAGAEAFEFALKIGADAPPGRHRNLTVEVDVPSPGGTVLHRFRGGELRIDPAAPAGAPVAKGDQR